MPNFMIEIGDKFDTDEFGYVVVKDIFISPTTGNRVYEVTEDGASSYYCTDASLTC